MRNLQGGIMNRKEIENNISSGLYTYGDVNITGCHYIETRFIPFKDILRTEGSNGKKYGSSNIKSRAKDTRQDRVDYYKDQHINNHMSLKEKLPTVRHLETPVEVKGVLKRWVLVDGFHKTIAGDIVGLEGYAYDVYEFDNEVREAVFRQRMNCPTQTLSGEQDDVVRDVIILIEQGEIKKEVAEVTQIVEEMWIHKVSSTKTKCVSAILQEAKIPIAFESLTDGIAQDWCEEYNLSPAGGAIDPKTKMRVVTCKEGYEARRTIQAIVAYKATGKRTLMRLYIDAPGKTQTVQQKRLKMLSKFKDVEDSLKNLNATDIPVELEGFFPQQKDGIDKDDFKRLIPISEITK